MPIVQGYHVPEINNQRVRPIKFNVLLLDLSFAQISTVSTYTAMLHDYLDTLGLSHNRINLHIAVGVITSLMSALEIDNSSIKFHQIDIQSKEEILTLSTRLDVDVILDETERFTMREIFRQNDTVAIVHLYNPFFNDLLNSMCAGWGVAWNFRDPIWNASWITNYLETGFLAKKVFDFMDVSRKQKYTDDQRNVIRNLSNKISQVSHSKQMLNYTLILLRYAKRHNLKKEDLLFELTYHLNNYYMFISSSLDVSARLINDVYKLGFKAHWSYTLDNQDFLKKLKKKRKGLVKIIKLEKYLDWMDWMRQRRNFFAHQSHLYLTPLVQRRQVQLSNAELDARVEASTDWAMFAASGMTAEVINNMKEFKKFQIDLEENHETVAEEIMNIDKRDRKTEETKPVIFFPLRAIEEDNKMFKEIINRLIDNLTGARTVR